MTKGGGAKEKGRDQEETSERVEYGSRPRPLSADDAVEMPKHKHKLVFIKLILILWEKQWREQSEKCFLLEKPEYNTVDWFSTQGTEIKFL